MTAVTSISLTLSTSYICRLLVILIGQRPAVTVLRDDLDPTKSPLSVPRAMIVYVTSHCSPLTVTVAVPLVIGAVPVM